MLIQEPGALKRFWLMTYLRQKTSSRRPHRDGRSCGGAARTRIRVWAHEPLARKPACRSIISDIRPRPLPGAMQPDEAIVYDVVTECSTSGNCRSIRSARQSRSLGEQCMVVIWSLWPACYVCFGVVIAGRVASPNGAPSRCRCWSSDALETADAGTYIGLGIVGSRTHRHFASPGLAAGMRLLPASRCPISIRRCGETRDPRRSAQNHGSDNLGSSGSRRHRRDRARPAKASTGPVLARPSSVENRCWVEAEAR